MDNSNKITCLVLFLIALVVVGTFFVLLAILMELKDASSDNEFLYETRGYHEEIAGCAGTGVAAAGLSGGRTGDVGNGNRVLV